MADVTKQTTAVRFKCSVKNWGINQLGITMKQLRYTQKLINHDGDSCRLVRDRWLIKTPESRIESPEEDTTHGVGLVRQEKRHPVSLRPARFPDRYTA